MGVNLTIYDSDNWSCFLNRNKGIIEQKKSITLKDKSVLVHYYIKKLGPFSIIGAPLFATTTGPMNIALDYYDLQYVDYIEILKQLATRGGVISAELLLSDLEIPNNTENDGKNIQISKYTHYEIDLTLTLDLILSNFSTNVKRKLKKSEKNKLSVKIENANSAFADKFYDMLSDVFKRQGKKPTYPRKRVRDLLSTEVLNDHLLCLGVYTEDNEKIASAIFVYNEFKSFFWGGASYEKYMYLCPNEKLHFEAMKILKYRGVKFYEFGGGGSYKERYGPVKKEGIRIIYSRYYWILDFRQFLFKTYKRYIQRMIK
jgi:hypothetical protein